MANNDRRSEPVIPWLQANGYEDVAFLINSIKATWAENNKKTRRNWWDILSGDAKGRPLTIQGKELPVLRAAQLRQGRAVSENALCRNDAESTPERWVTGRWTPDAEAPTAGVDTVQSEPTEN